MFENQAVRQYASDLDLQQARLGPKEVLEPHDSSKDIADAA